MDLGLAPFQQRRTDEPGEHYYSPNRKDHKNERVQSGRGDAAPRRRDRRHDPDGNHRRGEHRSGDPKALVHVDAVRCHVRAYTATSP